MRIMVFDVPAESGGALTILNQYFDKALLDEENEWIFVLSTPQIKSQKNVKVLNFPWIKKSWFHRLYFDLNVAPKLPQKHHIDEILSLQNVTIPRVDMKQTLYLHQSLPFTDIRYKISKNFKFWIYQNIISKAIYKSIKKADKVIVQTKWMIEAAIDKTGVSKGKFILEPPKLNIQVNKKYSSNNIKDTVFFYPAGASEYKNHRAIIEASKVLSYQNISNYKVVFTLVGNESQEIEKVYEEINKFNLPIQFKGYMSQEEVYEWYSKSVLVFPSYVETFGLPLLEAKMHNSPILASNYPFSIEILGDYPKVSFFDPFNSVELAGKMKKMLEMEKKQ